eukprot:TRINITY_DN90606_c0_g1_i1.p1 TRINITY_DN90606_c0_g1~~TRINITY_DN90606_c0_g1_i1.p1  ORF type:complete len:587 (-),score=124.44 TRINITY_DN90606_c0_g1_i1:168-1928(-)
MCRRWKEMWRALPLLLVVTPPFAAGITHRVAVPPEAGLAGLASSSVEQQLGSVGFLEAEQYLKHHALPPMQKLAVPISQVLHLECEVGSGLDLGLHVSQAAVVLAVVCLIGGAVAWSFAVAEVSYKHSLQAHSRLMLNLIAIGYCIYRPCQLLANLFMMFNFWFCGFYSWMCVAIFIQVTSQLYLAYEYAYSYELEEKEEDRAPIKRALACLLQLRPFLDADDSMCQGKLTTSFARQRFLESLTESGPLSILTVYVLFYLEHEHNIWLVVSLCGSVVGLAWGIVTWFVYSLNEQLIADDLAQSSTDGSPKTTAFSAASPYSAPSIARSSSSVPRLNLSAVPVPALHKTVVVDRYIKWYHQLLWICYFTTDYALRLLTIGLFLKIHELRPMSQLVFLFVTLSYTIAVSAAIGHYEAQRQHVEFWKVGGEILKVPKEKVAHRIIDCLILTFLVHTLPADVRRAPKDSEESRVMMTQCPEVRDKLVRVTVPLRAADYIILGSVAMFYDPDLWQAAALVSLYLVTHILLAGVLWLQRVMIQVLPTDTNVPETVRRYLDSDADGGSSVTDSVLQSPITSPSRVARTPIGLK